MGKLPYRSVQCFAVAFPDSCLFREVAPNQYEFAPMFGYVTSQIDQNLMVMQIAEEIAAKYNLTCLMHEKPFQGVNGSGKLPFSVTVSVLESS